MSLVIVSQNICLSGVHQREHSRGLVDIFKVEGAESHSVEYFFLIKFFVTAMVLFMMLDREKYKERKKGFVNYGFAEWSDLVL